jgi:putative spermidine/putrescine transport system ATP-binding protein
MENDIPQAFLSLRGLRKTYDKTVAIDAVSLDIRRGEFMTFLGPSGSGKSTTLYIVAGFEDASAGSVQLAGKSLLGVPSSRRNIGMVFQRYTLFPHLSVADNVAFPLRVRGTPDSQVRTKVGAMLELVQLGGYGHRMPAQLSGGQQQRVAIARALAYDPPLLLMDEPLSALDKKLREEMQFELRRIHRETGVTVLYVTHDQEEALRLSDRVALFNAGRIEQVGTGAELYEAPATRFVAGFIGNSNFLPVRVESSGAGEAELSLPNGVRVQGGRLQSAMRHGEQAALMVRPDRMRLDALGEQSTGAGFEVKVHDLSYLGDSMQYTVLAPWQQDVCVRQPLTTPDWPTLRVGDRARVSWDAAGSHVYAA